MPQIITVFEFCRPDYIDSNRVSLKTTNLKLILNSSLKFLKFETLCRHSELYR